MSNKEESEEINKEMEEFVLKNLIKKKIDKINKLKEGICDWIKE